MSASFDAPYRECTAGVQYDRHRHFALKVELGEVEHLFSKHLLLLHPSHAVKAESEGIIADHLRFHVAEVKSLSEDGTRASLDARLRPLLLGWQEHQVDLPGNVAGAFDGGKVGHCHDGQSQLLLLRVVVEHDVQGAIFGSGVWFVSFREPRSRSTS